MVKVAFKNNGFAIVYGLAVFLIASISGLSIIYISQKDRTSAGDYSKMRTAAVVARAALSAFEGQCKSQPQNVIDILKQYKLNPAKKWLLGDAAHSNSEQKIKCYDSPDAPSFSANIMKFDSVNLLLQVQGIGYGGFGGKKKAIGIYILKGIESVVTWEQKDAIHLAGKARHFDQPITVNGNVYCGADIHFNGGASGSVINGDFKTGNSSTAVSSFDGNITINGSAYFQTAVKINGAAVVTINGESGFEKRIETDKTMELYGNTYLNSVVDGNARLNMHDRTVTTYSNQVNENDIENNSASQIINSNSLIDIATVLDMKAGDEMSFNGKVDNIPSDLIFQNSSIGLNNITADVLNQKYHEAASNGKLWNDFLVVKVTSETSMSPSTGTFNGKVIWIVDAKINCNGDWYNCGASSNSLVYVRTGGSVNGLGSGKNFRGYVLAEGTANITYLWKAGNSFRGAIHHVSAAAEYKMNSGNAALDIQYDEDVLKEFVNLSVINPPGQIITGLVLDDAKIRSELLSISY